MDIPHCTQVMMTHRQVKSTAGHKHSPNCVMCVFDNKILEATV